jgi:Na+-transporting NADH:ubiquinone oxidoreductase subunit NqrB
LEVEVFKEEGARGMLVGSLVLELLIKPPNVDLDG